jgi:hypothetical protein
VGAEGCAPMWSVVMASCRQRLRHAALTAVRKFDIIKYLQLNYL